jgi:hypothetical protein
MLTHLGCDRSNVIRDTHAVHIVEFLINATDDANRDVDNTLITPIDFRVQISCPREHLALTTSYPAARFIFEDGRQVTRCRSQVDSRSEGRADTSTSLEFRYDRSASDIRRQHFFFSVAVATTDDTTGEREQERYFVHLGHIDQLWLSSNHRCLTDPQLSLVTVGFAAFGTEVASTYAYTCPGIFRVPTTRQDDLIRCFESTEKNRAI